MSKMQTDLSTVTSALSEADFRESLEWRMRSIAKKPLTHTRYAFTFVTELQQISMKFLLRGSGLRKKRVNFT
jgi:hypothetical protein